MVIFMDDHEIPNGFGEGSSANYRTYKDVPNRGKYLRAPSARTLLKRLPGPARKAFLRSFLSDSCQLSCQEILTFFISNSEISRASREPGSALPFEYPYQQIAPLVLDHFWLESCSGRQIFQRLLAIQAQLPKYISIIGQRSKTTVLLDNMGSGVGRDVIGALERNSRLRAMVHARFVDTDRQSLAAAEQIVRETGMDSSFSFHLGMMESVESRDADLLLLIGILCQKTTHMSVKMLRRMRQYVRPGGLIIFSTVTTNMLFDDPLADFIMRLHGWRMDYKTKAENVRMAEDAGLHVQDIFFDHPGKHHCMTVAQA